MERNPLAEAQDIVVLAARFGVDVSLVRSVVKAEGDIVKAVRCSIQRLDDIAAERGHTSHYEAVEILCRTIVHAMTDYIAGGYDHLDRRAAFVTFFGSRWAPIAAKNDPTHLNENWVPNVQKLWSV